MLLRSRLFDIKERPGAPPGRAYRLVDCPSSVVLL